MTAFLKASIWIAGVFIVIKCIFKYMAWLYYDKDKPLRDAVRLTWDYLSQHTYFDVVRAALQRLYDRLAGIFQKKIRFFYLFLFLLLLNAASLWLGKHFFDLEQLEDLTLTLNELFTPNDQLTTIDMMDTAMHPLMAVVSVFQLTLLDLHSFLFTMGIIYLACRSRSLVLFLIDLITDIAILGYFFVLMFSLLYCWLLTNLSNGLFGSFFISLPFGALLWVSYLTLMYSVHTNPSNARSQDPFLPLFVILIISVGACVIVVFIWLLSPSHGTASSPGPFMHLVVVFLIAILLSWYFRFFRMRPQSRLESFLRVVIIICFFALISIGIFLLMRYLFIGKFYELLPSAQNSKFVFILVCSSALPSLAHLLAMAAALIAKTTPRWLQQFINRHLNAITVNDDKVLSQLGNGLGGLGAVITAIIHLI